MSTSLTLKKVDYTNSNEVETLLDMLQMYAKDPMGGGGAINQDVLNALPEALKIREFMHSFLVFDSKNQPIAFANCIESFSTFSAKGVLNIHDFAVHPNSRGMGLSQFLLSGIADFAKSIGCTKLTLEVLEGNKIAIAAYKRAGFEGYELEPAMGKAMFWQKYL